MAPKKTNKKKAAVAKPVATKKQVVKKTTTAKPAKKATKKVAKKATVKPVTSKKVSPKKPAAVKPVKKATASVKATKSVKTTPANTVLVTRPAQLEALAKKFDTDKLGHGYIPHYAELLPTEMNNLLEVGCYKGASVRMWKKFYPDAQIHTVDLFGAEENVTEKQMSKEGIITYKGDQSDINFLYTINQMFETIIDDGSHNSSHQQITFKHLFVNNLRSGGIYVIEDLHCCKNEFFWGQDVECFEDTALSVFQQYLQTGQLNNKYFNEAENEIFKGLIKDVKVIDEKIVFITRA